MGYFDGARIERNKAMATEISWADKFKA